MTYTVTTLEDIANIPDEHIRELACDLFNTYQHVSKQLKPFGVNLGAIHFTPNGLGNVSFNIKFQQESV